MTNPFTQLPLSFKHVKNQTFDNFMVASNNLIIDSLHTFFASTECLFYLWGESGCGKTHLINASIDCINKQNKSAVTILPNDISKRENVSLIEMFDVICIDNVDEISTDLLLEEALFFWINEVRQANKKIVLASCVSTSDESWQLPDLISRLQSGRTHHLKPLDRDTALNVFNQLARDKGIWIDERVNGYLQKKCPMNMSFLSQLLKKMDEVTLIEKKHMTIPLLKKLL